MGNSKLDETEYLDQYDSTDDEYLFSIIGTISPLVGRFLILFSILEHELNQCIADIINDRANHFGYIIIEKMTTYNKIDLFYKMYLGLSTFTTSRHIYDLKKINENLEGMNSFRNNIVHANWQTLSADGFVRTKIAVDGSDGEVYFKKVSITKEILRDKIAEIKNLIKSLENYHENVLNF